jgi:hypothetical protein
LSSGVGDDFHPPLCGGVGDDFHPPQFLVVDTLDIDRVRSSPPPTLSIVESLSINQVRKQTNR